MGGGDVVGIDLSYSVDNAKENLKDRPNVHLVQCDLFNLPFKAESFDIIFSLGVLHHSPDAKKGFLGLVPYLKKSGVIAVWVYAHDQYVENIEKFIRGKITARLPYFFTYYLSAISIPLYYFYRVRPFTLLWRILPICMTPKWRWRWLDTFDFYTPKYKSKHTYPEVWQWFKEANLKNLEVLDGYGVAMRGQK